MELKPGSRWKSGVCDTEVAMVKAGDGPHVLECGGHAMIPINDSRPSDIAILSNYASGSQLGKRYVEGKSGIELLCTKAGTGSLSVDGVLMEIKEAKPLPSSD